MIISKQTQADQERKRSQTEIVSQTETCWDKQMKQDAVFFFLSLPRNVQMFLIKGSVIQLSHSFSLLIPVADSQESFSHSSFHDLSNPGL